MRYEQALPAGHPLLASYASLTAPTFDWALLQSTTVLERDDPEWQFCLVKEVHALLGSEAILREWQTPTIFLLRDPVYVVDSLFAAYSLATIYLDHEVEGVQDAAFLRRFAPRQAHLLRAFFRRTERDDDRLRVILPKLIAVELLQRMFRALAREFACAVTMEYGECCVTPADQFERAAAYLSLPWDDASERFLEETTKVRSEAYDPYSIFRDTISQRDRPLAFLSAAEAARCRAVLAELS